jgi:hypothetical protein
MVAVFLQYKWFILVLAEFLAWLTTFSMFLARYWWESRPVFWISFILSMVTGIGIQLSIAVVNIFKGQGLGLFEIVIAVLVIYGFTYGKKHVHALDRKVMTWARKKRELQL